MEYYPLITTKKFQTLPSYEITMILLVSSAVIANNPQASVVYEPYFSLMLHVSSYKPALIHIPSPIRMQADRTSPVFDVALAQ